MRQHRKLIVSLYGGIGNRVKPLLTGRDLAHHTDRELQIFWRRDHRFQAQLDQLWDIKVPRIGMIQYAYATKKYPVVTTGPEVQALATTSCVTVRNHDPLAFEGQSHEWESLFRTLVPSQVVRDKVRQQLSHPLLARPYVGMMVRAHTQSHPQTKATSPVSWFVARIQSILDDAPDVGIYLSCDEPSTQSQIQDLFPNVVAANKSGRYNSTEGVQEAVADLYVLALSSHLIGPAWSTFTHMAQALRIDPDGPTETPLTSPDRPVEFQNLQNIFVRSKGAYSWM